MSFAWISLLVIATVMLHQDSERRRRQELQELRYQIEQDRELEERAI